jgi:hypothetical protein
VETFQELSQNQLLSTTMFVRPKPGKGLWATRPTVCDCKFISIDIAKIYFQYFLFSTAAFSIFLDN